MNSKELSALNQNNEKYSKLYTDLANFGGMTMLLSDDYKIYSIIPYHIFVKAVMLFIETNFVKPPNPDLRVKPLFDFF